MRLGLDVVSSRIRKTLLHHLMNFALWLQGAHTSCDSLSDTAELSPDGKSLIVNFVFCGQPHQIRLAYDRTRITAGNHTIYNADGEVLAADLHTSVPGLEALLFSRENLISIYGPGVDRVEVSDEFDD